MQTRQVLDNLGAVLTEAGMDYTDVVSVSLFIADMDNFNRINQVGLRGILLGAPASTLRGCGIPVTKGRQH